jgi:1-deoxy-D-xylulose-5-phosphate reductoisomerase
VTAADALAHPTWLMGPKITVDSATYMNKGLEVIEAHHLFDLDYDCIDVLIQPQSLIHSMTEFADGSVKAHLGAADMRVPIQYALSWPDRWSSSVPPVDFRLREGLDFGAPDTDTFACLTLALAAGRAGGTAPAVLNAANEVAVAAFLAGKCGFLDIEGAVSATMDVLASKCEPVQSFEQLREVDSRARKYALGWLKR